MAVTTEVASIRVPQGTVARLKMLAHKKSLEKGTDISWSSMVRGLLIKSIAKQEAGTTGTKRRSNRTG